MGQWSACEEKALDSPLGLPEPPHQAKQFGRSTILNRAICLGANDTPSPVTVQVINVFWKEQRYLRHVSNDDQEQLWLVIHYLLLVNPKDLKGP